MARGSLLTAGDVGHCPHRVALERGGPTAVPDAPHSTEILRRIREASDHRARMVESIIGLHRDAVRAANPEATRSAMEAGAELIVQARLVDAGEGRRLSTVDLLVRTSPDGQRARYAPVIIKNNEITDPASTRRLLQGQFDDLRPVAASWVGGLGVRRNETMFRNGLTLSHATRVLEATDHEDVDHFGGVIDRQGRLWWFDLDNSDWGRWRLAGYDASYNQRLDILRAHERWVTGEAPFPTSPFWHRECLSCPFHDLCEGELESIDDVSLVRFTSLEQQALLREHGITTRRDLARLDPILARGSRGAVFSLSAEHQREEHLGRSLDKLDDLIYRARSAVRQSPLLIVEPSQLNCPVADVEIDIDMESYDDVTYLWGAYVTTRREVAGVEAGHRAFVSWEPLTSDVEADVFGRFWTWFSDVQSRTHAAGATFAAYCFWAQAEESAMNRAAEHGGVGVPSFNELELFRRGPRREWVDLHDVAKRQIQTDGPLGLKVLAKSAGFDWRDENPSGEASMTWYEEATDTDPVTSQAARLRLLEYNEDDCRATKALREWINDGAARLPRRDEIPPELN